MNTVKVKIQNAYDVVIGDGAVEALASFVGGMSDKARKLALVCDSNVNGLHADNVHALLAQSGMEISKFVFPAGEGSKNLDTYAELISFLASRRFSRTDAVVALGGGVTGDIAGFAAATYMRGIGIVQVPTSLLAMVDSSVGGKTGVDIDSGKNLVGAFHQPRAVFCDTRFLSTLPEEWRIDGMGEVLKYAMLGDESLFGELEAAPLSPIGEDVITRCVAMKRDIVEIDEHEAGPRKLLNLGHTFAHAIEKLSDYRISHGRAVATGIVMASRLAESSGFADRARVEKLASAMGYETHCPFGAEDMARVMMSDKKVSAEMVDLVLPSAVGRCMVKSVPVRELVAVIGGVL